MARRASSRSSAGASSPDAPLTIFGDGSQTRDYVYVTDVAEAIVRAATGSLPRSRRLDDRAFNVGTGIATSVLDLAQALLDARRRRRRRSSSRRSGPASSRIRSSRSRKREIDARLDAARCRSQKGSPTRSRGSPTRAKQPVQHSNLTPDRALSSLSACCRPRAAPFRRVRSSSSLERDARHARSFSVLLAFLSLLSWAIMFGVWRSLAKAANAADEVRARVRATRHGSTRRPRSPSERRPSALPRLFMRAMHFVADARVANQQVRERATPIGGDAPSAATLSGSQIETLHLLLDSDASDERDRIGRFLPWLATIGSVSPLIGLLGTVLGVIDAFRRNRVEGIGQSVGGRAGRGGSADRDGGGAVRRDSGDVRLQHLREPAQSIRRHAWRASAPSVIALLVREGRI